MIVVYARNPCNLRNVLWEDVKRISNSMRNPWCVVGDFNNVLFSDERIGRDPVDPRETVHFMDCIVHSRLTDISVTCFFYTWSNSSLGAGRICSRIDRCIVNHQWYSVFLNTGACFKPNGVSDHCPIVLYWYDISIKASPFRFSNGWVHLPGFLETVNEGWKTMFEGNPMFVLIQKLAHLKHVLKSWMASSGPGKTTFKEVWELIRAELAIIQQRNNCNWLTMGDRCTSYFHSALKEITKRNAIYSLQDEQGNVISNQNQVVSIIVKFYEDLMGAEDGIEIDTIIIETVTPRAFLMMIKLR
ncbi:Ribonuclease h domain [Thalictrum thalictroides]|uniref:Ribonuclease h domain n=1 Tax=Thalictrum thalictroides TaxID=46969 RepID=A0A7J6VIL3_THATH|nr:Ribonuclease h domain [Thalictrum thalictroides]